MIDELKNLLDRHRRKVVVTCDSACMCWSVENLILFFETKGLSMGNPVVIDWDARLPGTIRVGWRVPCDCGTEHEDVWWGQYKK